MNKKRNIVVDQAIKAAGGPSSLAGKLGIERQAVSQWKRIPVGRVLTIEEITGISRSVLRPDIYPPENPA